MRIRRFYEKEEIEDRNAKEMYFTAVKNKGIVKQFSSF